MTTDHEVESSSPSEVTKCPHRIMTVYCASNAAGGSSSLSGGADRVDTVNYEGMVYYREVYQLEDYAPWKGEVAGSSPVFPTKWGLLDFHRTL